MQPNMKKLFTFGQMGQIVSFPNNKKLDARAATESYLQILGDRNVMLQFHDVILKNIRKGYFHVVRGISDSNSATKMVNMSIRKRVRSTPK